MSTHYFTLHSIRWCTVLWCRGVAESTVKYTAGPFRIQFCKFVTVRTRLKGWAQKIFIFRIDGCFLLGRICCAAGVEPIPYSRPLSFRSTPNSCIIKITIIYGEIKEQSREIFLLCRSWTLHLTTWCLRYANFEHLPKYAKLSFILDCQGTEKKNIVQKLLYTIPLSIGSALYPSRWFWV